MIADDDFEWHAAKARRNYRRHGVTFDAAKKAFADPFAIAVIDGRSMARNVAICSAWPKASF